MKRLVPLISLAVAACAPAKQEREASPVGRASAATRWVVAEPARASAWLEAPARAVAGPHDTALISVPLSARVVRVRVRPGQQVAAGEALADVVMPELIRAAGALRSADLRLVGLQKRRERVAGLLAQELALAAELSEVDGNIASVRGERESARATLRAAGESDERAAALLEGSGAVSLRAPFAGVVVQVNTRLGEVREPSGGPIVELASSDEEHLIEARFAAAPPDGVRFEWLETGRTLPLVLDRVSPHASQDDGSRNAWLHVPSGQPQPVAGAFGRVRMVAPNTWVVLPARALITRDGALLVATKTSHGPLMTPVTLVQHSASDAVVTGIAPGTLVAADATLVGEASK